MDHFEEYINKNRSELDRMEEVPMEAMWAKIAPQEPTALHQEKRKVRVLRNWVFGLAASVILLVGIGLIFWTNGSRAPENNFTKIENPIATLSPEMAGKEQDFKRLISQKEKEIKTQLTDKQAFTEIFEELELLEKIHLEYQQDISEFPDQEQLIRTLTRYYEQKIRILERLSREIQQYNHDEERSFNL